jgi:hypothetical protein
MYVTAIHSIQDPEQFWSRTESVENLPEGVTLHSVFPNDDGSRAVCLWEAGSQEDVEKVVEDAVGDVSSNEFYAVNAENAQGLPARTAG